MARAKLILPHIINWDKVGWTDQGLIEVVKMQRLLETSGVHLAHNASYSLRKRLVEELHKHDDALLKQLKADRQSISVGASVRDR